MLFKHFGDKSNPVVILLHGGGLSWWMWQRQIAKLYQNYHIIAPIIDGHDIDGNEFSDISNSADHLIDYIDKTLGGQVMALCGFSLGAQVALDVLAKRPSTAQFAVIESALTEPLGPAAKWMIPLVGLSYGLIKQRWFARAQAGQMFIPEEYFETYFESSQKISKTSLIHITKSNADFRVNPALSGCEAKTLILAGEKEVAAILASAEHLGRVLPAVEVRRLAGYWHGELCIGHPDEYVQILRKWIET